MVFQVTVYTEDDGSTTLSMDDMDLAVNASSKEESIKTLCRDMGSMRRNTAKRLPCIPERLTEPHTPLL